MGGCAWAGLVATPTPGASYTVVAQHHMEIYWLYVDFEPICSPYCATWYDALGFTYPYCSPECMADPFCYCVTKSGKPPTDWWWMAPQILALVYFAERWFDPTSDEEVAPVPQCTVSSASIPSDQISVTLGPPGLSGTLTVELLGGASHTLYQGTRPAGSHNISFNVPNLPGGQEFTHVRATWSVRGSQAQDTHAYHFKVLGVYTHTQYNTPQEDECGGIPTPITVYDNSCVITPNAQMLDGFIFRVLNLIGGTGSGHSRDYGLIKHEFYCASPQNQAARRNQTLTGAYGPVGNTTIAVCPGSSDLDVSGRQVYIHGQGVKTVTDLCPRCCTGTKIDNYTTSTACSGIGSLPDAMTIILY